MKLRTRSQRSLGPRPRTVRARELQRQRVREDEPLFDWALRQGQWGEDAAPTFPRTRGECLDAPRPCPWVRCRHHLYLDVKDNGLIRYNFPGLEVDELKDTCSLDVADRVKPLELTLERVGDLVNLTRERVHLIVLQSQDHLRPALEDDHDD